MATTASSYQDQHQVPNVVLFPESDTQSNKAQQNDYNYNNNHTRARAREMLDIDETYEDVMGRKMPRFVEQEILGLIADGCTPGLIRAVLEYTACAPRPSWAYARTVIYRNMEQGVRTDGEFEYALTKRGRAGHTMPY